MFVVVVLVLLVVVVVVVACWQCGARRPSYLVRIRIGSERAAMCSHTTIDGGGAEIVSPA